MKLTTLMATVAAFFVLSQSAHAHEHRFRHVARHAARRHIVTSPSATAYDQQAGYGEQFAYPGAMGSRPAAWCGWEMRQLVGSDPGPQYNLARNWSHWGSSGPAGVGAVVVWPHHVGKIVGKENGEWVIESGNDGNRVRPRPLSIAGAIAIRWG